MRVGRGGERWEEVEEGGRREKRSGRREKGDKSGKNGKDGKEKPFPRTLRARLREGRMATRGGRWRAPFPPLIVCNKQISIRCVTVIDCTVL